MKELIDDHSSGRDKRLAELREQLLTEEGLKQISRLVTLGELALCFSHEVKTPLTGIIGGAVMLSKAFSPDDPMWTELHNIERFGLRIKGIAENILDFGRKRERGRDLCEAEELFREAVRFSRPYFTNFSAPSIIVRFDVDTGCPRVVSDRWQLIHVLINLLLNAADAMEYSRQRIVTLTARCDVADQVRISVADTGSGIAQENCGRVFTPFFTTKGERGNGLGLYIARQTIEDNGGSIALQTSADGTVFTICMPAG